MGQKQSYRFDDSSSVSPKVQSDGIGADGEIAFRLSPKLSIATVKIYQIRPILGGPPLTDLSNLGSDGETKESCSGTSSHNTEDRASAAELMDDEHLNPDLGLVVDGGNYASADEAIDSDPIDSSVLKEISPQEQLDNAIESGKHSSSKCDSRDSKSTGGNIAALEHSQRMPSEIPLEAQKLV